MINNTTNFQLFKSSPFEGLILLPDFPRFTIAAATNAYLKVCEIKESAILGTGFFETFEHSGNIDQINNLSSLQSLLLTALEKREPATFKNFNCRTNKSDNNLFEVRYVDLLITPVMNESNLPISIIVSFKEAENNTETKNIDIKNSQYYRSIFENALSAFFLTIPDEGIILEANKTACEMFGYSVDEFRQIGRMGIIDHSDYRTHEKFRERNETGKLKAELVGIKKNGKKFPIEISSIIFSDNNVERRASLIINDITERENAENALLKSEYFLQEAQKLSKIGSWNFDLIEDKLTWTKGLYDVFGANKETFKETHGSFVNLVVEEDQALVIETSRQSQLTGEPFNIEYRIITPNGESRIIEEYGYSEKNANGNIIRLFGTAQDITERKNVEKILKLSEKKYRTLFEDNPLPMIIWDFETQNIIDCNQEALLKYGYTREEFLQLTIRDIRPKEDIALIDTATKNEEVYGQIHKKVWRHLKKNGELMLMEITAYLMDYNERRVSLVLLNDITEKEKILQQLKLLESVITNTNDAILITEAEPFDEPGPKIVYVNEAFSRMTGYSSDEVIGKTPRILQGPKSNRKELARLSKAMRNWESCEITTINYKKNGEAFWINFSVSPVANEKGWVTHWISIERDVTQRKNEELQKLLLTEISRLFNQPNSFTETLNQVLQNIVATGNYCMAEAWMIDTDKKHMNLLAKHFVGDEIALFYTSYPDFKNVAIGLGLPGIVGKTQNIQYWNSGDDNDYFIRKKEAIKAGIKKIIGIPLFYNETIIGSLLLGSNNIEKIQNDFIFQSPEFSLHLGAEIKRKQLEQELKQVFDYSNDIICIADLNGYFKKINPVTYKLLEYSEDELLNRPYTDFLHPEDLQVNVNVLNKLGKGEPVYYYENRYITKSAKTIWLAWTSTFSPEEKLIFSVAKDITEKKNLEVLLNKSNKLSAIGSWEYDVINKIVYWSDITKEIREVEPDFVPDISTGIEYFKEGKSRETISQRVKECIENGTPWDEELQIFTHKGNLKWIRTIGEADMVNGNCIRIYGSFQDIDTRKKSEIKLAESENRFRTILEAEPECIKLLGPNDELLMMNQAGLSMIEADTEAQVVNKSILGILLPEHRTAFSNLTKNVFKGESGKLVFEIKGFKGTRRWMETHAVPLKNEHGDIISLLGITRDITERKEAEENIRQTNERFEKVTQATNDAIWDWDIVNDNFYRGNGFNTLFGYEINKNIQAADFWQEKFHSEDLPLIKESLQKAIEDPNAIHWQQEYRIIKNTGKTATVIDRGIIIRSHTGKAIRMVGAMTDITHRKEYEESLMQLNEKLELQTKELATSNKELEQFAYVASHDLQEPLRMVTSFLTQLEKKYGESIDDKGKQYIFFAVDGAKRMRQIILDLLEFSRIGKQKYQFELVNINELVSDILLLLANRIEESKATIEVGIMPIILSNKTPLSQVFQNLISNSLKYQHNDRAPIIKISCSEIPGYWMFSIKDNGIGINEQYFEKIFIIFQRLHNKDEYTGTGIGLSIVKKIINNLEGKIWVESEEGKGTVFYFTLPKLQ